MKIVILGSLYSFTGHVCPPMRLQKLVVTLLKRKLVKLKRLLYYCIDINNKNLQEFTRGLFLFVDIRIRS